MLLQLYRSNLAFVLFFLPLLIALLWIPYFFGTSTNVHDANVALLFQLICPANIFLNKIVAIGIILLTAFILTNIVNSSNLFNKNTYLPALLYVLMMSCIGSLQQLHPVLIGNLFLVLAVRRLMNIQSQVSCKSELFDASFFIVLAFLFAPTSMGIFLLLPWLTLLVFRPFHLKEYIMPVLAFLVVMIYTGAYSLITGEQLLNLHLFPATATTKLFSSMYWVEYIALWVLAVTVLFSVFELMKKSSTSTLRFKKRRSFLLLFCLLALLSISYNIFSGTDSAAIMIGAIPLSILFTHFFFYTSKLLLKSLLFYTMMALELVALFWLP